MPKTRVFTRGSVGTKMGQPVLSFSAGSYRPPNPRRQKGSFSAGFLKGRQGRQRFLRGGWQRCSLLLTCQIRARITRYPYYDATQTRAASGPHHRGQWHGLLLSAEACLRRFFAPEGLFERVSERKPNPCATCARSIAPLRRSSPRLRPEFAPLRPELPPELGAEVDRLGKRSTPDELSNLVVNLCRWRPLSLPELSALTGKTSDHLRRRNLRRLLEEGRIRYAYPSQPHHPHQKYTAGRERK